MFQCCHTAQAVFHDLEVTHTETLVIVTGPPKILHTDQRIGFQKTADNITFEDQTTTVVGIGMAHLTEPH